MKLLLLPLLALMVACGSPTERGPSSDQQSSNSAALKVLESANALVELKRKAQPQSWDVSLEESMTKENPLVSPKFVFNSGVAPRQKSYLNYSGLWNCQKLDVGSEFCQDEPDLHMIASHYIEDASGEAVGQVAALRASSSLAVYCKASEEAMIRIAAPNFRNSENQVIELEIGFDDEPLENYELTLDYQDRGVITQNKRLLAKLMKDYSSMQYRALSISDASTDSLHIVVKNFPKAWAVACGWHSQYDAAKGMR